MGIMHPEHFWNVMAQLPLKKQIVIAILLFTAIQVVSYLCFWRPAYQSLADMRHHLEISRLSLTRMKHTVDDFKGKANRWHETRQRLRRLEGQMTGQYEPSELINRFAQLAVHAQVRLKQVRWLDSKQQGQNNHQPGFYIELTGNFSEISQWMAAIAQLTPRVIFLQMDWQRIEFDQAQLNVTARGYIFQRTTSGEPEHE
jgi:Tfp pilus assembly protein PilO